VHECAWLSSATIVADMGSGRYSGCDCLFVQSFVPFVANQSEPYGSPDKLPLLETLRPTASTTTPDLNYPDVSSGGLMALANATTNFALRFVGERASPEGRSREGFWPPHSLTRGTCDTCGW